MARNNDAAARRAKDDRIELRIPSRSKALIRDAAATQHLTITDFILSVSMREAERVLALPQVVLADEKAWERITAMMGEAQAEPGELLVARLRAASVRR